MPPIVAGVKATRDFGYIGHALGMDPRRKVALVACTAIVAAPFSGPVNDCTARKRQNPLHNPVQLGVYVDGR